MLQLGKYMDPIISNSTVYTISNLTRSKNVLLKDLPYWIMLYDKTINGTDIHESNLWTNYDFCKYAVTKNGLCLQYIKKQTYELCVAAVVQNGMALEYADSSLIDYKLCLSAVKCYRFAIKFVPKIFKTEELCLIAIKGKARYGILGFNVKDMMTNTDPEYIENGYVLQYINDQTLKIITAALEATPSSYIYVQNKTPEIFELHSKCIKKIEKDSAYYEKMLKVANYLI